MMPGHTERYDCPLGCGWFREWHESPEYLFMVIYHPIYGAVYGCDLLERDIRTHNCRLAWDAHMRSPKTRLAARALRELQKEHGLPVSPRDISKLQMGPTYGLR